MAISVQIAMGVLKSGVELSEMEEVLRVGEGEWDGGVWVDERVYHRV